MSPKAHCPLDLGKLASQLWWALFATPYDVLKPVPHESQLCMAPQPTCPAVVPGVGATSQAVVPAQPVSDPQQ